MISPRTKNPVLIEVYDGHLSLDALMQPVMRMCMEAIRIGGDQILYLIHQFFKPRNKKWVAV
ncbi:hypothetical protein D3C84_828630 [compost metagenome]